MSQVQERARRDQVRIEPLGVKNLTEVRAMLADKLIDAASKKPVTWFAPVVDGRFLIEPIPETYAAGRQAHVPTIIGWNRNERVGMPSKAMTAEKWKAFAAEHYGNRTERFLARFRVEVTRRPYDLRMPVGGGSGKHWQIAGLSLPLRSARNASGGASAGKIRLHSDELEYLFGPWTFGAELHGTLKTAS